MWDEKMQTIEIDLFWPEDTPGVVRLFRQVYGEGYPIFIGHEGLRHGFE